MINVLRQIFHEWRVSSTLQQTDTLSANLLPDLVPTHLLVYLLRALPCCSIVAEQSQSCLLVPMVHLSQSCEHAHACVRACVFVWVSPLCVGAWEREKDTERERERNRSDYVPIYTCYCFPRMWGCGLCNFDCSPLKYEFTLATVVRFLQRFHVAVLIFVKSDYVTVRSV